MLFRSKETVKRLNYSESRRNNKKGKTKTPKIISKSYDKHMGNGNGIMKYDFIEERFNCFYDWLDYKRERKQNYKSEKTIKTAYDSFLKMADNNPDVAKKIIEKSIMNNWAGLFELKTTNDGFAKGQKIIKTDGKQRNW